MSSSQLLLLVAGALANVLFAGAVGLLVCASWPGETHAGSHARLNRLQLASIALLMLVHIVHLWLQTVEMGDVPTLSAGPLLWPVLSESHYGKVWLVSTAGLVVAMAAALLRAKVLRRGGWTLMALGLALYACGRAGASHAADAGDFSLAEWVHWLHLCSVGVWAGSVLVCGFILLPRMSRSLPSHAVQGFCARLSQFATVAFVVAVASGIYNIRHIAAQSGSTSALAASHYGHIFMAKALLVLVVIVLAGINRQFVLPNMQNPADKTIPAVRRFTTILQFEAVLMLLLLVIAAWLAHSSPLG